MRLRLVALLLASLLASPASAACPATDYSGASEFRRADYVAEVRVIRETWLDENWRPTTLKPPLRLWSLPSGLDPYTGAYYSVELTRSFKGKLPASLRIFSENTTARTPLEVGGDYLVFLQREAKGDAFVRAGALTIDNWGNSGPWMHRRRAAQLVEKLARRSH